MTARDTRQRSCEARLPEHLARRLDYLHALIKAYDLADDTAALDADEPEADPTILNDEELTTVANMSDPAEARRELAALSSEQLQERVTEALEQLPLAIETRRVIDVCISTGGPEDRFEFYMDSDNHEIERIFYVFKDWFDGARHELTGEEFDTVSRAADLAGWTEVYQ